MRGREVILWTLTGTGREATRSWTEFYKPGTREKILNNELGAFLGKAKTAGRAAPKQRIRRGVSLNEWLAEELKDPQFKRYYDEASAQWQAAMGIKSGQARDKARGKRYRP